MGCSKSTALEIFKISETTGSMEKKIPASKTLICGHSNNFLKEEKSMLFVELLDN